MARALAGSDNAILFLTPAVEVTLAPEVDVTLAVEADVVTLPCGSVEGDNMEGFNG